MAVLRLNRPEKLNAFTYDTLREIRAAIDACAADTRVVGIVITGNGRGFCAGLDAATLAAVTSAPAAPRAEESDALPGIFSYLLQVPKPVICGDQRRRGRRRFDPRADERPAHRVVAPRASPRCFSNAG